MSQSIGSIKVKTSSLPTVNVTTGAVKIAVNSNNPEKVRSIQYLANPANFSIINAQDVQLENTANNNSVLTYDASSQKFLIQNVPGINGGTF